MKRFVILMLCAALSGCVEEPAAKEGPEQSKEHKVRFWIKIPYIRFKGGSGD